MSLNEELSLIEFLKIQFPEYSTDKLKAKIIAGAYRINGETVYEPNRKIKHNAILEEQKKKYVSRGGFELDFALSLWSIDVTEKVMLDAGSSTGGFTDCLLQAGARSVHAVDVGYNQLDFTLRRDKRVCVHERLNIMDCTGFTPPPAAAVADLSFRSIISAAEHLLALTIENWAVVLIKPQFELPKGADGFYGVVKDHTTLRNTVVAVVEGLYSRGISVQGLCKSPITGRKGNIEFLAHIKSDAANHTCDQLKVETIEAIVENALIE